MSDGPLHTRSTFWYIVISIFVGLAVLYLDRYLSSSSLAPRTGVSAEPRARVSEQPKQLLLEEPKVRVSKEPRPQVSEEPGQPTSEVSRLVPAPTLSPGTQNLDNTYDLYDADQGYVAVGSMKIFNQEGASFDVQGSGWSGRGNLTGSDGFYDWRFTDGKTGRTEFSVDARGVLHGHVKGSGINWSYVARPR
jgi:hypothetical protein